MTFAPGDPQPSYTDALEKEMFADARRNMGPEFDLIGNMERMEGRLAVFFHITEAARRR